MNDLIEKLYIEPTSNCNLSCSMCFRKTWFDETFSDMEWAVFAAAMDTMPDSVNTVFFGGMGEPLYHPDIIDMVKKAAKNVENIELLTNGTLLTKKMSKALIEAGLTGLWLSVDSFEKSSYENIRQCSNFALIMNNIASFNAERMIREHHKVSLGITFVAMKSNVGQLGDLGRFAKELSVDKINISNVIPTDEASQSECLYARLIDLEVDTQVIAGVYPQIDLPMMDMDLPEVGKGLTALSQSVLNKKHSGSTTLRRKKQCHFIEEGIAFVRHDGDVSPCMALLHSAATYLDGDQRMIHHYAFGNVKDAPLDVIWNSSEYAAFRSRFNNFKFSPCIQCVGCEYRDDNAYDCMGNTDPTCGACLWSEGIIKCL